jgi:uncharacterized protein YebE (UPF0316 family)
MKEGIILFLIEVTCAFLATVNMRSIAQGNYFWTAVSDILIALLAFTTITKIVEKSNRTAKLIGFVLGAVVGSLGGIFLSKIVLGK